MNVERNGVGFLFYGFFPHEAWVASGRHKIAYAFGLGLRAKFGEAFPLLVTVSVWLVPSNACFFLFACLFGLCFSYAE